MNTQGTNVDCLLFLSVFEERDRDVQNGRVLFRSIAVLKRHTHSAIFSVDSVAQYESRAVVSYVIVCFVLFLVISINGASLN